MSKIKTNPKAIKDYITAVKNSELSDSKKEGITRVLQQYSYDKQAGIWSDGVIKQALIDIEAALKHGTYENEQLAEKVGCIIKNMSMRDYASYENA